MSARAWHGVALLVTGLAFVLPLLFLLNVSLHPPGRGLGAGALSLVEEGARWANYAEALARMGGDEDAPLGGIGRLVANTALITVLSILGQLFTCSLAGYAFARIEFRGRDLLFLFVLATMMLPEQVTAIPRFLLFRWLGLVDTYHPLVLPTVLGGAPFFIFLFRQYFLALPPELAEAARVDGLGHFGIWRRIYLPLARPMLVTVGLFTFLATWNDFWAPLIYILSPEKRTLTLALAGFNRSYDTAVELMMAATGVVLLPCVIVYFLAQRLFLRGVEVAASKR